MPLALLVPMNPCGTDDFCVEAEDTRAGYRSFQKPATDTWMCSTGCV